MKRLTARFYISESGSNPVRDWLMRLSAADRNTIGKDLYKVELGWPIGMPVCRPVGRGLYEVRSTISDGKVEARVYFRIIADVMLLLEAHSGKGRQKEHIGIAASRFADVTRREKLRTADLGRDRPPKQE